MFDRWHLEKLPGPIRIDRGHLSRRTNLGDQLLRPQLPGSNVNQDIIVSITSREEAIMASTLDHICGEAVSKGQSNGTSTPTARS